MRLPGEAPCGALHGPEAPPPPRLLGLGPGPGGGGAGEAFGGGGAAPASSSLGAPRGPLSRPLRALEGRPLEGQGEVAPHPFPGLPGAFQAA